MKYTLKHCISDILADLTTCAGSPRFARKVIAWFFSTSFHLLALHRIGHYVAESNVRGKGLLITCLTHRMYRQAASSLSPRAVIGRGFRLPHPTGVIVGDGSVVGNDVTIFQQVTLGNSGRKERASDYPVIEDQVTIYAGAKIVGGIRIGAGAVVAAGAVVLKDVPPNAVAAGVPAKVVGSGSAQDCEPRQDSPGSATTS